MQCNVMYACIIRTYLCLHHFPMVILAGGHGSGLQCFVQRSSLAGIFTGEVNFGPDLSAQDLHGEGCATWRWSGDRISEYPMEYRWIQYCHSIIFYPLYHHLIYPIQGLMGIMVETPVPLPKPPFAKYHHWVLCARVQNFIHHLQIRVKTPKKYSLEAITWLSHHFYPKKDRQDLLPYYEYHIILIDKIFFHIIHGIPVFFSAGDLPFPSVPRIAPHNLRFSLPGVGRRSHSSGPPHRDPPEEGQQLYHQCHRQRDPLFVIGNTRECDYQLSTIGFWGHPMRISGSWTGGS